MRLDRPALRGTLGQRTPSEDRYNDLVMLLYPQAPTPRARGYAVTWVELERGALA